MIKVMIYPVFQADELKWVLNWKEDSVYVNDVSITLTAPEVAQAQLTWDLRNMEALTYITSTNGTSKYLGKINFVH